MEAATTFARPGLRQAGAPAPTHPTFIRWLWLWITVGFLVVVVVIGFLLGIVSNLKSIDTGLVRPTRRSPGSGRRPTHSPATSRRSTATSRASTAR